MCRSRRRLVARVFASASFLLLGACGDDVTVVAPPAEPAIRAVVVSPGSTSIRIGETLIMVAIVSADSGADRSVSWSSADPRRVAVTANGIVTGVAEGVAVVTATSRARGDVQGSATIAVLPAPTVRQLAIVPASLSIRVGQSTPLVPVIVADSGADRTVLWSSVDPSRVSVSSTGVVTALAEGTGVITATSRARPEISASAAVSVVPAAGVRSVAVTPQGVELEVGSQQSLAVTVDADPGVARAVSYTSSAPTIASVTVAGVITALAPGIATITVASTADPRVAAVAVVTVRSPAAPTVSIQSVTQGGTTLPVNLAGAAGQLDVLINVAPGSDPLARVDLIVSQGGRDTVVASQVYSSAASSTRAATRTAAPAPSGMSPLNAAELARHVAALPAANTAVPTAVVLSFRSNMYDPATGTVAFRNAPSTIRAVARSVAGAGGSSAPAASNTVDVTLRNLDGFHVSMRALSSTGIASANDALGLRWEQAGAGLEVTSVPVTYSGATVGARTIRYPGASPAASLMSLKPGIAVDTLPLPDFSAPTSGSAYASGQMPSIAANDADGNPLQLAGTLATDGAGILNLGAAIVAGTPLRGLRIDNAPPPVGATFTLSTATQNSNNWVNGPYEFSTGLGNIVADAGVGLPGSNSTPTAASVQATYRVTGGALTDTALVQRGSDLAATDSHLAYAAEAVYADRLGNPRRVAMTAAGPEHPLSTFGVDVLPPTVRFLTSAPAGQAVASNQAVYTTLAPGGATLAFGLEAIDDRAGFGATPVYATVTRLAQPNPIGAQTGTTTCVVGTLDAGSCVATAAAFEALPLADAYRRLSVPVDGGTGVEGYYSFSGLVRDQAGNSSVAQARSILYDQGTGASAPIVSTVTIPPLLRGNQPVTLLPVAVDNVELVRGSLFVSYPNLPTATALGYESTSPPPSNGAVAIGTLFDALLTSPITSGNVFTIPQFIRALEIVDGADAPQPYNAATVKPDGVNAIVYDGPSLAPATVAANVPILGGFVENPATATPGFAALTGTQQLVAWRRTPAGTSPLRFEAVGPSGQTHSPFARVLLLQLVTPVNCAGCGLGPNTSYWRIVAEVTAVTGLDNGLERLWRYDFGSRSAGQSYIAVGVSSAGDALASQVVVP